MEKHFDFESSNQFLNTQKKKMQPKKKKKPTSDGQDVHTTGDSYNDQIK